MLFSLTLISITVSVFADLGEETVGGIHRSMSEGVTSTGFKIIYGDEDMTVINQVVSEDEKISEKKKKMNYNEAIKPLPAEDVKCLMSVDRYCSKEMGAMKSVLIKAIKEDCKDCTQKQKEEAGIVVASMMAHDPVAWKLFLTRSALLTRPRKPQPKKEHLRLKVIGKAEEVERSPENIYQLPGVKVRVKRYASTRIP